MKNSYRINRERFIIHKTAQPVTKNDIITTLKSIGVAPKNTLIVHCSMSSMGWVVGGYQTVIEALKDTVTGNGNIIMASYTGQNSDPSTWENPYVPKEWIDIIRENMPPYNPLTMEPRGMGALANYFWKYPNVMRSNHPQKSFLAWGGDKDYFIYNTGYDFPFGWGSPLCRAYDTNASILLIGVSYNVLNSFYMARNRCPGVSPIEIHKALIMDDNQERKWIEYKDYPRDTEEYKDIWNEFISSKESFRIGNADCYLINQRELIDFTCKRLLSST